MSGALGEGLVWTERGSIDFNASNDADFVALSACLLDGSDETVLAGVWDGTGTSISERLESEAFGSLRGHSIEFVRLVVANINFATEGGNTTYACTAIWEIWGH